MEKQICSPNTDLPSSPLLSSMHKKSQTISKRKPKIRIIHIFAPEIIKTDAANFRELVQRLTGKPTETESCSTRKKEGSLVFAPNKKMEIAAAAMRAAAGFREKIKGEDEIWSGANSGGGFLGDFDGFLQQIHDYNGTDHFPFLETTTQMDHVYAAGETQLA